MVYRYRDIYLSNKVDILHNSNQECSRQHVSLNAVGDIDKESLVELDQRRAIKAN